MDENEIISLALLLSFRTGKAETGGDIDGEVFALIESTGFKMLCGEPHLLRNLVKLGYCQEETVKNEINSMLRLIKEDRGFGCISTDWITGNIS